jgi:hypothetical protein
MTWELFTPPVISGQVGGSFDARSFSAGFDIGEDSNWPPDPCLDLTADWSEQLCLPIDDWSSNECE